MRTTYVLLALGLVTVGNGVYTLKLHRQMADLAAASGRSPAGGDAEAQVAHTGAVAARPAAAPAPRLAAPLVDPATLPLPAPIATDAARDLLRQFVAGEVARLKQEKDEAKRVKKEEKRVEKDARREKDQVEYHARLARELGLGDGDARRVSEILLHADKTRRQLRQAEQDGRSDPTATANAIAALRQKTQTDMRAVLGDSWSTKLAEAQRKLEEARQKERQAKATSNGPFWFTSQS